jgi:hypothetical protein
MCKENNYGTCKNLKKPGDSRFHLWVVITDPDENNQVVIVNLTTKRDGSDETVILNSGDHRFITRPTVVNYNDARVAPVSALAEYVREYGNDVDLDNEILKQIQAGVFISSNTKPIVKEHCQKYASSKHP